MAFPTLQVEISNFLSISAVSEDGTGIIVPCLHKKVEVPQIHFILFLIFAYSFILSFLLPSFMYQIFTGHLESEKKSRCLKS